MMMSNKDNKPYQISNSINDQEEICTARIDLSVAQRQKSKRNVFKRSKEGDDSFKVKHRLVDLSNQYFNKHCFISLPYGYSFTQWVRKKVSFVY